MEHHRAEDCDVKMKTLLQLEHLRFIESNNVLILLSLPLLPNNGSALKPLEILRPCREERRTKTRTMHLSHSCLA